MASRSRSRGFALQLLYSADIHAEGLSSKLYQAQQQFAAEEKISSDSLVELQFIQKIESASEQTWDDIRREVVQKTFTQRLLEPAFALYQAQLELPEHWYHEQRLNSTSDIQRYNVLLQENVEPMDAYRIVSDKDLAGLFHFFCEKTLSLLEQPEDFAPSIVAHWLLRESQFEELINLEIDWTPLFETLCLLQKGTLTTQSARILLKKIRQEYDPSNKQEKRSVEQLAEGRRGNSLILSKVVRQSLHFEPDSLLNSDYHPAEPEEIGYANTLVCGVAENIDRIDELISIASRTWELDRMSVIDRNIMRLGCYELGYQESVPSRVVINESINLTKLFSGSAGIEHHTRRKGYSDGVKFVNGILDRIARELGKKDLEKKKH
ncbi:MAG: transcription antitermination factor NusB [Deltaproteobacteria bacterium]|nr:transcription antitermination factor NusB [Deltaproteobacteria bacterium]